MPDISNIKINKQDYRIDFKNPIDLSIPINNIKSSPLFYDNKPIKINYYTNNQETWSVKDGAPCNIPIINLNIHCGATHTECRSHITKEKMSVTDCIKNSLLLSHLISVTPSNKIENDSYHYPVNKDDLIITKDMLYEKIKDIKTPSLKSIIVRTLPNSDKRLNQNYNINKNAFFSNEAIYYLKSIGIENLIVDLPSIDKYDDGGKLGNHRIFWGVDKGTLNQNTITELTYIKNQIEDGEYLLSLNMLNLNLDASPSRPIIYKVLK